jgi:HrpA-like RNA helicase
MGLLREAFRLHTALPAYGKRSEFLRALDRSQVVIVRGATGSGKSTQLAQYLADAQLTRVARRVGDGSGLGLIACLQPRSLAAV